MPKFPPVIGPARLHITGHIVDDGPQAGFFKVTQNGNTAKLYHWDDEERQWVFFDTLKDAELIERVGHIELTGISTTLRNEVHVPESEAKVTIQIREEKCASCG